MEMQSVSKFSAPLKRWLRAIKKSAARLNLLFLLTVVAPTTLATAYFGLMASDIYISESRFVVRSPDRPAPSGLGALLKGAGFSRSQDDTYTVHEFLHSRDALEKINRTLPLSAAYGNRDIDMLSRFDGLHLDDSKEALHRYFQNRIVIELDSTSSISALKVSAFKAEDAHRINSMLLEMSEHLINQLNERGRQDMIRFAASEVGTAEEKVKAAGLALSSYRNDKSLFDPERQSALQLQLVSKIQDELIATKTQLDQVRTLTPDNPRIPALQKRAVNLQAEIDTQMAKVAGGNASLTNKASEYERLTLDRAFAERQLAAALASLEQARNDAQRKQLYLERIVQPHTPDIAMEPRRLRNIVATFLVGMILWGVLSMLLAGVREHQD